MRALLAVAVLLAAAVAALSGGVTADAGAVTTTDIVEAPTAIATRPLDGAIGVDPFIQPAITFSRPMDGASFTSTNVSIRRDDGVLLSANRVYYAPTNTLYIAPIWPLDYLRTYTVTLETSIRALDGAYLEAPISISFTVTGTMLSKRFNSGGGPYLSTQGETFATDSAVSGGLKRAFAGPVTGTTDPALYADERYGSFTYTVKIPNGTYDVVLHFVETQTTRKNVHVFGMDVVETSGTDISGLDLVAAAGYGEAYTRTIPNVTATQSVIRVRSIAYYGKGDPTLAALEIVPAGQG